MATEVVRTIRATGGDYSTYSGWVAGEARDLVSLDEIAVAEIYHDWPAGLSENSPSGISNTNFTTDADHPVILRAAAGHRHNGTMMDGSGNYTGANLVISGSGNYTWTAYFMVVDGLILRHSQVSTSARHLMNTSIGTGGTKPDNLIILRDCIGGCLATNPASSVFRATNRRDIALINCLAYEGQIHFTFGSNFASNTWALNCTSIGAGNYGFFSGDNNAPAELINCLATDSGAADFNISGGNKSVTYCAASDSSLPVGTGNRNSQTFVFRDAANDDYRLDPTDTGALGYGQDLSAHSVFPFSADILGVARGATWDVGAFQTTTGPAGDIDGDIAITEEGDTFEASGEVEAAPVDGDISISEGSDALAASGTVAWPAIDGVISITEGSDSLSASGSVVTAGAVAISEGNDALAASGDIVNAGQITITEANDTLSAEGELAGVIGGTISIQEGSDSLSAFGSVIAIGQIAIIEADDSLSASGNVLSVVSGDISITEASDALEASGNVLDDISGDIAIHEDDDVMSTATPRAEERPSGGWAALNEYRAERQRRKRERERLKKLLEEAPKLEEIHDEVERKLAEVLRKKEEEELRRAELERVRKIAETYREEIHVYGERVQRAAERAIQQGNWSALEAFDREMRLVLEEEEFLIHATMVLCAA